MRILVLAVAGLLSLQATALLIANQTAAQLTIANERLHAVVEKASGAIVSLTLDGQSLLGTRGGVGPYLDCYCIPSGFWTPGPAAATYQLYTGADATGTKYGGIRMSDTYRPTGQVLEQYWFLREGETGLHTFSRAAYHNKTTPFLRNLQELRTLFRPSSSMWTHLSTNEVQYAPLPGAAALAKQVVVQDATWYLGNTPDDPYVRQESDYFTKYTFHDSWRNHDVHGM
jgi:rhamnogalacturonan endolyase